MSALTVFFFFKQKTAYEMRISDWSSDVCSSDLTFYHEPQSGDRSRDRGDPGGAGRWKPLSMCIVTCSMPTICRSAASSAARNCRLESSEIGRASCRERVCQYV